MDINKLYPPKRTYETSGWVLWSATYTREGYVKFIVLKKGENPDSSFTYPSTLELEGRWYGFLKPRKDRFFRKPQRSVTDAMQSAMNYIHKLELYDQEAESQIKSVKVTNRLMKEIETELQIQ